MIKAAVTKESLYRMNTLMEAFQRLPRARAGRVYLQGKAWCILAN
ncbi:hypothetical protein sp82g_21 [Bacillus phage SP82G]|nr:hypothetical protein sp82g_21 [Bacillus phage SP82G]